ncbi:MAG: helix-turn-helix transcriptional regulator [Bacilli bacterium]
MNQEKIGKFIKEIRKKNNLTQNDLASKLGVTYQAVSKWENGKNIPDISLLKEMSQIFDVDIDELLDGEKKKKKKRNNKLFTIILSIIIVIVISILIIILTNHDHSFEFKTLTSSCDEFDIIGSMAYNSDKTSIYISDVNYCGTEESTVYDELTCALYENYNDNKKIISSCMSEKNISLKDYLKNVKINVDDYSASCKSFTSSNLYLEINATLNNQIITYIVPITINDNCLK